MNPLDLGLDLLGRLGGLLGQLLYLVGHHGETLAGVTGPRSLDGGVQGQQVGLLGYFRYHFGHLADLIGGFSQFIDLGGSTCGLSDGRLGDGTRFF